MTLNCFWSPEDNQSKYNMKFSNRDFIYEINKYFQIPYVKIITPLLKQLWLTPLFWLNFHTIRPDYHLTCSTIKTTVVEAVWQHEVDWSKKGNEEIRNKVTAIDESSKSYKTVSNCLETQSTTVWAIIRKWKKPWILVNIPTNDHQTLLSTLTECPGAHKITLNNI